ncbi:hypothetical protein QBC38DRAFT_325743, partial [Podospora fimiseda]
PLEWEIPLSLNDSTTVKQYGTVQEVYASMTANYPGWDYIFPLRNDTNTTTTSPLTNSGYTQDSYTCLSWGGCDKYHIVDGINYLNSVLGKPRMDAGPAKCVRVSCSWNSAIFMCKCNDHEVYLGSFRDVAGAAQFLVDTCKIDASHISGWFSGQVFYKEKWNAIVKWD